MKNNGTYFFVLIFFILPFIFYFWSIKINNNEEKFTTEKGCYWSQDDGKCVVANFTPSLVNIINDDTINCSSRKTAEDCIGINNIPVKNDNKYFWYQKDGIFKKKLIDIKQSAANNAGYNSFTEKDNIIYENNIECEENLDKCEIHNYSKKNCLKQQNCGWCTDGSGNGICVYGTPIGPLNNNFKCRPSTGSEKYNFTMGLPNQYFM